MTSPIQKGNKTIVVVCRKGSDETRNSTSLVLSLVARRCCLVMAGGEKSAQNVPKQLSSMELCSFKLKKRVFVFPLDLTPGVCVCVKSALIAIL